MIVYHVCSSKKLNKRNYGNRDPIKLDKKGGYFTKHMNAMTEEKLDDKADIAMELAYRDYLIDILKTWRKKC